jgi:hypothetical protein
VGGVAARAPAGGTGGFVPTTPPTGDKAYLCTGFDCYVVRISSQFKTPLIMKINPTEFSF